MIFLWNEGLIRIDKIIYFLHFHEYNPNFIISWQIKHNHISLQISQYKNVSYNACFFYPPKNKKLGLWKLDLWNISDIGLMSHLSLVTCSYWVFNSSSHLFSNIIKDNAVGNDYSPVNHIQLLKRRPINLEISWSIWVHCCICIVLHTQIELLHLLSL